jgi:hypothetical protein
MFRSPLAMSLASALVLTGCVIAPDAPVRTPDGLVKVQSPRVDSVYAAPGLSLARYRRVMLDNVDVAFRHDWQTRHPQIPAEEVAAIRHGAASLFRVEFSNALEKGGYPIANEPAPDVLRVAASIVDLDFVAPNAGAGAAQNSFVVSSADMSLVAELRDSQSGAMLARVADQKRGRSYGNLQVADQKTNTAEARAAFAAWAGMLRDALDAARYPLAK